jgi:hypothetical protein
MFSSVLGSNGGGEVAKAVAPTATLGSSAGPVDGIGQTFGGEDSPFVNLMGPERYAVFETNVRDFSIIAAGVRRFLNLIASAEWTVNPPDGLNANEAPIAQGYADAAYDMLFGMTTSWSTVVRKAALFRFVGFVIMEWTAKRLPDGTIGLKDIEMRPQRSIVRWVRDGGGTVEAVVQQVPGRAEVTIPIGKCVYAVDNTLTEHPEGQGLFHHLAKSAHRLQQFLDLEKIGFETDLKGIPVARGPLGELQAAVNAKPEGPERVEAEAKRLRMIQPLRDFVEKHVRSKKSGMLLPSDTFKEVDADGKTKPSSVPKWAVELLTGDASSFAEMAAAITRMNHDMARVLGQEDLMLGENGGGSLALGKSKTGTFYVTVTSTLSELVEVFDRDIMAPIAELNGWPDELRPQLAVSRVGDQDIAELTQALNDMASAGAVLALDDPAINEVRDMLGLSHAPEMDPADASLNARRKEPDVIDDEVPDPEADEPLAGGATVNKSRWTKSRRARRRRAK